MNIVFYWCSSLPVVVGYAMTEGGSESEPCVFSMMLMSALVLEHFCPPLSTLVKCACWLRALDGGESLNEGDPHFYAHGHVDSGVSIRSNVGLDSKSTRVFQDRRPTCKSSSSVGFAFSCFAAFAAAVNWAEGIVTSETRRVVRSAE